MSSPTNGLQKSYTGLSRDRLPESVFPVIIILPDDAAVLNGRQREDRREGWFHRLQEVPLLIIYARARGTLRRTRGHYDKNRVRFIYLQRSAVGQLDACVGTSIRSYYLRMTGETEQIHDIQLAEVLLREKRERARAKKYYQQRTEVSHSDCFVFNQHYRVGGYTFFTSDKSEMFGCCGFDTHLSGRDVHHFGKTSLHPFDKRIQFRCLCANSDITIPQLVSGITEHSYRAAKKDF